MSIFPKMVYPIHISNFAEQIIKCMMDNCSHFELLKEMEKKSERELSEKFLFMFKNTFEAP